MSLSGFHTYRHTRRHFNLTKEQDWIGLCCSNAFTESCMWTFLTLYERGRSMLMCGMT